MAKASPVYDTLGRIGGGVDRAATTVLGALELEGVSTVVGIDATKAGRLATSETASDVAVTNGQSGTAAAVMLASGSALARRRSVIITNWHATATLYVSDLAGVAASGANRGIEIPPRTGIVRNWGPEISIHGIASSAATDWQIEEGN